MPVYHWLLGFEFELLEIDREHEFAKSNSVSRLLSLPPCSVCRSSVDGNVGFSI